MAGHGLGEVEGCTGVRVEVRLSTPMALYSWPWVNFDGLLVHLALREYGPDWFRTLPTGTVIRPEDYVDVPLARLVYRDRWIYAASVSMVGDVPAGFAGQRSKATIYKRFDTKHFPAHRARRRRIETAKGEFRSWRIPLVIVPSDRVEFYALTWDPGRLRQLLEGLAGVGARRAAGFGVVREVRVEEGEYNGVVGVDGRAQRPIPLDMLETVQGPVYTGTWKPPYWDRRNVTRLAAPGARVVLRRDVRVVCGPRGARP